VPWAEALRANFTIEENAFDRREQSYGNGNNCGGGNGNNRGGNCKMVQRLWQQRPQGAWRMVKLLTSTNTKQTPALFQAKNNYPVTNV